ncbi:MAG TPA: DUF2281 domain-containing protein [Arcobacter sp.]|nr:DUF2281 domain-containing protein [Arcobacter sp.]
MDISKHILNFEKLPIKVQKQIINFIDNLISKYQMNHIESDKKLKKSKFNFDWEGKLKKDAEKFSSVELQHKANDLRG